VLVPACKENRTGKTSTTGGIVATGREGATMAIATARCARAARCNEISSKGRWPSDEACRADWKGRLSDDLSDSVCPKGISQKEIDKCAAAIRDEDCSKSLESFERFSACRTSSLCL
jgi:hypothetical protein